MEGQKVYDEAKNKEDEQNDTPQKTSSVTNEPQDGEIHSQQDDAKDGQSVESVAKSATSS